MKPIVLLTLMFIAATVFTGCGAPAENKTAANPANAAAIVEIPSKPASASLDKDALMGNETRAWGAWKAKDGKYFDEYLADNAIDMGDKGRSDKASLIKRISDTTCEVGSFSLSDDQMTPLGTDAALLTYKAEQEAKCGGKELPKSVWAATVVVRSGDKWKAAYHSEIPVSDPKAAAGKPSGAKPAAGKPAAETKPAADSKSADAATEALLAVERKGWDAWKARDAKGMDGMTTKDFSVLDSGQRFDAAGAMKWWFESKCDIKSYSLNDPASTSFTKDVSILTFKATAVGVCEGQPLGATWSTSVYVKDGNSWKLAFATNTPVS